MKIFLVIVHILLGLVLVFYGVNALLHLARLTTQAPSDQYYYGTSLSQGFLEAILWTIVGIFSSPAQPARETWIVLTTEDPEFPGTGLKTASVIKAERIAVIEGSVVVKKLGSLSTSQMERLRRTVKVALQLD